MSSSRLLRSSILVALVGVVAGCQPRALSPEDASFDRADADAGFAPDSGSTTATLATRLTPSGDSWWDPEVLSADEGAWMTFQDERGEVFLATLDPMTGLLSGGGVRSIGDRAAPLLRTFNGPEFGLDAQGISVHYTRIGEDGLFQSTRVRMEYGEPRLDVLTEGVEHFSPLASKIPSDPSTRLIMLRRPPEWGTALWVDDASPEVEHELFPIVDRTDSDARWISGSRLIVTDGPLTPTTREEVSVLDTDTGEVEIVSNGEGVFGNPYGWFAPDAGDALQVIALTDDLALTMWRRAPDGWSRVATIHSPVPSLPYFGSPEPFAVRGRSFVSAVLASEADPQPGVSEQQVWLFSLDGRDAWRCDDGAAGATRADPEVLVLGQQVFVYYYTISRRRSEVWVCATRVPT
ncbi:MAG: hypothetical protein AB8I08_15305 [Sandaracinaceae bacterium]